jgi:hypothetical protein
VDRNMAEVNFAIGDSEYLKLAKAAKVGSQS